MILIISFFDVLFFLGFAFNIFNFVFFSYKLLNDDNQTKKEMALNAFTVFISLFMAAVCWSSIGLILDIK